MPNDAKLGLVAGVSLVIVVAVVFYRRDLANRPVSEINGGNRVSRLASAPPHGVAANRSELVEKAKPAGAPTPAAVKVTPPALPKETPVVAKSNPTKSVTTPARPRVGTTGRYHVTQDGESLVALARRYYGTKNRTDVLAQVNGNALQRQEELVPGTILFIPDLEP